MQLHRSHHLGTNLGSSSVASMSSRCACGFGYCRQTASPTNLQHPQAPRLSAQAETSTWLLFVLKYQRNTHAGSIILIAGGHLQAYLCLNGLAIPLSCSRSLLKFKLHAWKYLQANSSYTVLFPKLHVCTHADKQKASDMLPSPLFNPAQHNQIRRNSSRGNADRNSLAAGKINSFEDSLTF